ncbi:MAG TPA: 50S ribosomal protein L11 methyltransferase [Victivallales bacterium]|nr:50S ribosomal protein L11 methyltransferase [Victivallales bacterium]
MKERGDKRDFEVEVSDIAFGGDGVARADGKVLFMPGVIDGEKVSGRIVEDRKRFAKASCSKIILASPHRIEAKCPLAFVPGRASAREFCPGCSYQHVSYAHEIEIKKKQLIDLILRIGRLPEKPDIIAIPSPQELHYRNKISLHLAKKTEVSKYLGYVMTDNKSVIEIKNCPLAVEPINSRISEILSDKSALKNMNEQDVLFLRFSHNDGVMDWIDGKGAPEKILKEKTCIGELVVPLSSFFQTNVFASRILFETVLNVLEELKPKTLLDFYCGTGIFALSGALSGAKIAIGVESDFRAVEAAKINAENLRVSDRAFFLANFAGEEAEDLLTKNSGSGTMAIVDPPRSGMEQRLLTALMSNPPEKIVYVSCAPDTMSRDMKILCQDKYAVEKIFLADLFPRTPHFESVVLMGRR